MAQQLFLLSLRRRYEMYRRMTIFAIIVAGLMIGYLCSLIKQKEDEDE